jgi:hypothetical protein
MAPWSDHLLRRLHEPGSARHLALFRIATGLWLLYAFASPAHLILAEIHPPAVKPTLLPAVALDPAVVGYCATVGCWASLFLIAGLLTPLAAGITFVGFLVVSGYYYVYTGSGNGGVIYFNFLTLLLFLSPCADTWSADAWLGRRTGRGLYDQKYRWPAELGTAWFAMIYVAAAVAKMFPLEHLFTSWLRGADLQSFAARRYLESPLSWELGGTPWDYTRTWQFGLMAVAGLGLELAAGLLVLTRRFHLPIVAGLLAFHVGNWALSVPFDFVWNALVLSLLLLPPWVFHPKQPPAPEVAQPPPGN